MILKKVCKYNQLSNKSIEIGYSKLRDELKMKQLENEIKFHISFFHIIENCQSFHRSAFPYLVEWCGTELLTST